MNTSKPWPKCAVCGKEFYDFDRTYCSKSCYHKSRRNKYGLVCRRGHERVRSYTPDGEVLYKCPTCLSASEKSRRYGYTIDQVLAMEIPDRCEICGRVDTLVFDHNHKTGRFRGYLCNSCNTALGMFQDSPEVLNSAIAYLMSRTHYGS